MSVRDMSDSFLPLPKSNFSLYYAQPASLQTPFLSNNILALLISLCTTP